MVYVILTAFLLVALAAGEKRLSPSAFVRIPLIHDLRSVPGYFTAAYLVDRIGRKATMGSLLTVCAVSAYMFGNAKSVSQILV